MGRIACCQSGCSSGLIVLRRPNSSAALICVSGWKRDLSLPKQRGSKDHPEGPHSSPLLPFPTVSELLFFFLTLSLCWRSSSQGESSLINVSDHSTFCVFQPFSQQLSPPRPSITGAFGSQIFLLLLFFSPQPAEPNQFQVKFKA